MEKVVQILNEQGVHARPASIFSRILQTVRRDDLLMVFLFSSLILKFIVDKIFLACP